MARARWRRYARGMQLRNVALRVLLVSVAASALIGIVAILGGDLGKGAGKALATSLAVSGAGILAVAAFSGWDLPAARVMSRLGVVASAVALVLVIYGIWREPRGDTFWQLVASTSMLAAGGAHGSLLALAILAPRYQWARTVALACSVLLIAAVLAMIWEVGDDDGLLKVVGVLAIAEAALTVTVGVLRYASRAIAPAGAVAEVCFCPGCGKRLWLPAGEIACRHCGAAFLVELRTRTELPGAELRPR